MTASDYITVKECISDDTILSLLISETCNLNCRMCGNPHQSGMRLAKRDWLRVIDQARELGIRRFVVTGGEPFHDELATEVLHMLCEQKERNGFRVGVVTNGVLLSSNPSLLDPLCPSYIDVSIDGNKLEHERLRGTGTYELAVRGVRQCLQRCGSDSIYVCMILTRRCNATIPRAIKSMARLGISNIYLQPLLKTGKGKNCSDLVPDCSEIAELVERILSTEFDPKERKLRIKLWVYPSIALRLSAVSGETRGSVDSNQWRTMTLFRGNHADLLLAPETSCSAYLGNVLISADGIVAGCCVDLDRSNGKWRELDNVRNRPLAMVRTMKTDFDPCGRFGCP